MKKLMYVIGLGLISGSVWATCLGPFCYDQTGAAISGIGYINGNGFTMPNASSTTISGIVPLQVGQIITCTTCANGAGGTFGLCVSSATNSSAWVLVSSPTQKCQ